MKPRLLKLFTEYRLILIWLGLLAIFGYTLWRLQAISNPSADKGYIQKQQTSQTTKLEIKDSLRAQLERLVDTPVDTQPDDLGRADPFNP